MLGVAGDLIEDIVVWLTEPLRWATDTEVRMHRRRGGSAANVAAFAAPRHPTRFIGAVGADPTGDALIAELASHGVDVRAHRHGNTGTIVVLVDQDGERSMLPDRGTATQLRDVPEDWTADLDHLHLPGYSFTPEPIGGTSIELARRVRAAGGTVSVDTSSTGMLDGYGRRPFLALLCDLAPGVVFANRAEADLLGLTDTGLPGSTVVVKDGARPTTVLIPDRRPRQVPVPPVAEVRDLTGAGDAFAAGFLTAMLDGAEPVDACTAGHARAADVLCGPGASIDGDEGVVRP